MKLPTLIFYFLLFSIVFSCKSDKKEQQTETEKTVKTTPENLYNGWEDKILDRLTVNKIPNDFPRYKTGETNKEYKARIAQWAEKNLHIIKPHYREKAKNFEAKRKK